MGLNFSAPKTITNGTTIVCSSPFPENKISNNNIWNLWKYDKDAIKADGFSMAKYEGNWKISYFHKIGANTYEKNNSDMPMWRADLNKKLAKWNAKIEKVSPKEEELEVDELDLDGVTIDATNSAPKPKPKSKSKVVLEYEPDDDKDLLEAQKILSRCQLE